MTGVHRNFSAPVIELITVCSLYPRYAHYDDNPSFSDFSPFGGWNKPSIKQYAGDKTECGVGVDLNYY